MAMSLVFPRGEHPQVRLDPGVARIGSDPAAEIVLGHPGVQPQHAQLHVNASGVMLEVPHGTHVEVNGRRVDGLIALRPGDSVAFDRISARLAASDAAVHVRAPAAAATPAANDETGATCVRAVLPMFVLRGVSGGAFGRSHALAGPLTVGRSPECGIHIDAPGLSRLHARLVPTDKGVLVEDLESTNGTYINERRVRRQLLRIGDEIRFDQVRFRLAGSGPSRHDGLHPVPPEPAPLRSGRWAAIAAIAGMLLALAALGAAYLA